MKKLILTVISTLTLSTAFATVDKSTSEYTTQQESSENLLNNNFQRINQLNDKFEDIDYILTNFAKCEAKNKVYLGDNVKGADKDGCFDVQNITVKRKSKPPVFVGYTNTVLGNITASSSTSYTDPRRIDADELCSTEHANTRAMTYDDIKYVLPDLKIVNGSFNHPSDSKRIWVFDAEQSFVKAGKLGTRFDSPLEHTNCRGWAVSTGSTNSGLVLEIKTNLLNHYIQYNSVYCTNSALIACVKE
jgi:hypothetical protein